MGTLAAEAPPPGDPAHWSVVTGPGTANITRGRMNQNLLLGPYKIITLMLLFVDLPDVGYK